jgi:hypothetical protein
MEDIELGISYENVTDYPASYYQPAKTLLVETGISRRSTSENSRGPYANNWNENNERIIKRWIEKLNQNSFIYDYVSENYTEKHSTIQIILLFFNSILTVISFLQFNSENETELEIYKYLIMVISTFVTFVINFQRIKKYETKFNDYSSISLELSELTLSILSQIEMPYKMRPDFNDYIKIVRQKYYSLMNKLPNMNNNDYISAFKKFDKFKNIECKQNFRHQLANDIQIIP